MPVARRRGRIGFIALLWLVTAAAVAWLLGEPLALNAWAGARWQQTPCHANKEDVFYYWVAGVKYMNTRRDFWMPTYVSEKARVAATELDLNDACWVNPANPLDSVLRLDAYRRWDRAVNRGGIAVLLLAVTAALTYFDPQRRAARRKGAGA